MTHPSQAVPIGSPSAQHNKPTEARAQLAVAPPLPPLQTPPTAVNDDPPAQPADQAYQPKPSEASADKSVLEEEPTGQSWEPRQQTPSTQGPKQKTNRHSAPKQKPPKAQLHPNAVPPTYRFSLATWHWWLNKLIGRRDKDAPKFLKVPEPGKREQAQRQRIEEFNRRMEFKLELVLSVARLRALLSVPDLVLDFYVSNQRGRSHKTTVSFLIGSAITWIGQVNAILWTATLNTSIGAAAAMSGLPPEMLENSRLSRVVENHKRYHTPQDVFNGHLKLARTSTGLVVVVEDRHGNDGRRRPRLTPAKYQEVTKVIRPLVPGPSISDGGNDGQDDGDYLYQLGNEATVHIYVADAHQHGSLDNLYGALNGMRSAPATFGKDQLPENELNSYVPLPVKAANAVIVASDWSESEPFDFEPWLAVDQELKYEVEPLEFTGVKLTTPHEPSLESKGPHQKVSLNWFSLTREMQLAGMRIVIEAARMAAKMQHVPVEYVFECKPDFDAAAVLLNMDVSDVQAWYQERLAAIASLEHPEAATPVAAAQPTPPVVDDPTANEGVQ